MDDLKEFAEGPIGTLDREALLAKALKLLGMRDYAETELRARLSRRAASDDDVETVLSRLKELGFLNEARFAARKAEEAAQRRLVGSIRIRRELEARELAQPAIDAAVDAAYHGQDEAALARQHLETRLASLLREDGLEDERTLLRAYGRLRRAGFGHADTVAALRCHSRLARNFDEFVTGEDA